MNNDSPKQTQLMIKISFLVVTLIGLYFTTWVNYLLFHTLAELFSIVVAFSLFMIAWNSKKYISNPYLLFIGVAYLFIAFIDLLHTLSYKGMPIFIDYDYYANQLWIGARYLESITLLLAFIYLRGGKAPRVNTLFVIYTAITCLIIASVFYWKIFPECFVDGVGLTPFKKVSEYIICGILAAAIFLLWKNRERFEGKIYHLLLWSMICTILSELAFTFYISNYGFSNLVGHYFKILSFLLVYEAIIKTGIESPFELIFLDLDRANKKLNQEIENRIKIQQEKEQLIDELKQALEEIKTLKGILPICSHCKNIRDDQGYWSQIEQYIHDHSEAQFSHGICPDCMKKHYPDFESHIKRLKRS
ncbi:MASE3 domain-containing protein [Thermodesulfobacteriota bacterium]